ncbi:hypothetical protein [Corynebacterium pyruviciproducens]|nr:hypothetical protein [Corynebacterium pyruviciproducens]
MAGNNKGILVKKLSRHLSQSTDVVADSLCEVEGIAGGDHVEELKA